MILAGDIGGTKSLLALFREEGDTLQIVRDRLYRSRQHGSLEEIVADFLRRESHLKLDAACFGVAGPVFDGVCLTTNLPWRIDEAHLARLTGTSHTRLLNDLEASAYGMLFMDDREFVFLNIGTPPDRKGNIAVIASGTGLGEAILYWDGSSHHPIATEGGHTDFAPNTEQEISLLRFLRAKHSGHVSWERVLSGPGLQDVHAFLRTTTGIPASASLAKELATEDAAAAITREGLAGTDPICQEALEIFAHAYGVEAGNLALKAMALGGVFLGGGIAPKILPSLQAGAFMRGFVDKGRFSTLLNTINVAIAMNARAPLIGAAHFALHRA